MPAQETIYKIFIASPSGLNTERKAFADVIEEYNKSDAQHRGVSFRAVGWEDTLAGMGRPQEAINEELKECDFFLLLLHNRWGSNPGKNAHDATSGTEEEFNLAMDCYKDKNSHMKQIVCTFKSVSPEQLADPGKQLEKVLEFRKKLEESRELLYTQFFSLEDFQRIIRKHLGRWLLNHENDTKRNQKIEVSEPMITEKVINVETEQITIPTINKDTKEIIKNAQKLADEGKLTEAEIEFSKAIIYSPNAYELLNYVSFLMRIGQLDKASMMLGKVLEDKNTIKINTAFAYLYLGRIMQIRGELDDALLIYHKSLEISKQLDHKLGMAYVYGNLGILLQIRGDLEDAESSYKKSLEISKQSDHKVGMASAYGNLGNLKQIRGDLDAAELMYQKCLEINEELNNKEGTAYAYGNLGIILKSRGDLDSAESMYQKSLKIKEQLGLKEGMANQYNNLAIIMSIRKNFDSAEKMFKKSLEIEKQLGRKEGVVSIYLNLGVLMQDRGDLSGAEKMYKKCFKIAKAQGFEEIIEKTKQNLELLKEEKEKNNS